VFQTGCATHTLNRARDDFYAGRYDQASSNLSESRVPTRDRVLFLMERGTVRQAMGDYEGSSRDFIEAYDRLMDLETYSISRGTGSLVINDNIKDFVGAPYERTLLHALTAQNHFARGDWDLAAVEARRILMTLNEEVRGNYPDEAYSRYLAGLAFEFIDDPSNASLQYRLANELRSSVVIDPATGRLGHVPFDADDTHTILNPWPDIPPPTKWDAKGEEELVVVLQIGRSPRGRQVYGQTVPVYAEIYAEDRYLGRSYILADTARLRAETEQIRALREAAKTISRIIIKEGVAVAVESKNNQLAGDLVRLVLIGLLEQPDVRAWETLPRWFQVARVPAPAGLDSYTVVLKNARGQTVGRHEVEAGIQRRRGLAISFFRI
jgi:hypothetical protein